MSKRGLTSALERRLVDLAPAMAPSVDWSPYSAPGFVAAALVRGKATGVCLRLEQLRDGVYLQVSGSDLLIELPLNGSPLRDVLGQFDRAPIFSVTSYLWPPYAPWEWIDIGGGHALTYTGRLHWSDRLEQRLPWYREERRLLGRRPPDAANRRTQPGT